MLFHTIEYAIFFPIVVFLYFLIPHKFRWALMLAASYYFYACWKLEYLSLIVISTIIDYFAARQIAASDNKGSKKAFLLLSLASNLGILFFFKYFNFFSTSAQAAFDQFNIFVDVPTFDYLLPVGISFYTFQTLSYTIDVYKGNQQPEKHFGIFALFVSFFPQLVAGPIERSTHLLPQFHQRQAFDFGRLTNGLKLILWGLFKKVIIGDSLSIFVDSVYSTPASHDSLSLLLASICFAFQIYADFSGYTDIARGSAQVIGFDLMENFKQPYTAKSISEFWRRWHISLSTWFRDYVYIPLGGNRTVKWRWYYNLFVTFTVSGLWHGANWTFVLWGALHGFYLIFAIITEDSRNRLKKSLGISRNETVHKLVQVLSVFVLVLIGWVFFRAENISDAFYILGQIFDPRTYTWTFSLVSNVQANSPFSFALGMGCLILFLILDTMSKDKQFPDFLNGHKLAYRWTIVYILLFCLVFFTPKGSGQFIYFQF
ncbi:MAG: MBOAT family O-acyltransferase [Bacteroidota bacterium]